MKIKPAEKYDHTCVCQARSTSFKTCTPCGRMTQWKESEVNEFTLVEENVPQSLQTIILKIGIY